MGVFSNFLRNFAAEINVQKLNGFMGRKRTTIFIDILFCGGLLPLIILLLPIERWFDKYPLFTISQVAYLYALYYAIRRIHLPALFFRRKYWRILCFVGVSLGIAQLLSQFPFETEATRLPSEVRTDMRARTVWLLTLVVFGFSLSVELLLELLRQAVIRKDIEAEKQKAELALYKAQINPHFLFNTLNSIYGLVISKSDLAERAMVKFASLLQYMYKRTTADTIAIREEVDYISHYIDLQSLRLNHHTHVTWETDIDDEQAQVPPMVLITFVENAFKYGVSPSVDCDIAIRLSLHQGHLSFRSENALMRHPGDDDAPIGIENCRSRLALLYPQRFTLEAGKVGEKFQVCLNIHLP